MCSFDGLSLQSAENQVSEHDFIHYIFSLFSVTCESRYEELLI